MGKKKPTCVHVCGAMFFSFWAEGIISFVPKFRFLLSAVSQTYAQQTEAVLSSSFYNYLANCNLATHAAVFVLFPKHGIVPLGYLGQISSVELTAKRKSRHITAYLYSRD